MPVFLFTDIEGSTEKWEKYKKEMGEVLSRHDAIIEENIKNFGGRIIKHLGDGFFAVFEDGRPIRCAVEIQKQIAAEEWGTIGELRIRIALHAGDAQRREKDYFGPVVIRTYRILSVAWGGQILLTPAVIDLEEQPEEIIMQDLGVHMLKDLGEPQQIYNIVHPDFPLKKFPPLKSLSRWPHNLPSQPTPFIGREKEIAETIKLIEDPSCKLLAIIGPGGIGKTRLALQVAAEIVESFRDGVYFIPLASLTLDSVEFLVFFIAESLGFSFYSREDPKIQLLNFMQEKEMLLLMDNFEHVIGGVELLTEVLRAAPHVKIVVTSRERLNIKDEWIFEVGGMRFPEREDISDIVEYSAVQLFCQTARRVNPKFVLTDENKPMIVRICHLVGGIPLGVELAASWVRVLSPKEISFEIERSLNFLKTSLRDIPKRHRSLRAVFEYSWNLLSEDEKIIFRQLSVFRGGFERRAAKDVCEASLDQLTSLVDKSLLRWIPANRYEMLEALRVFADEKLNQHHEEKEEVVNNHCCYYANFLKEKCGQLVGLDQRSELESIGKEIENIRASWNWAVSKQKIAQIEDSIEGLYSFYELRGWFKEGEIAFKRAADKFRRTEELGLFGRLMSREGMFCYRQAQYDRAKVIFERCLAIFKEADNKMELARALHNLGHITYRMGEVEEAKELYNESLEISKEIDDTLGIANSLNSLGVVTRVLGNHDQAKKFHEESIEISKEVGYQRGVALSFNNLGNIAIALKDYKEAKRLYQECLIIFEEIGDVWGIALSNNNLGYVFSLLKEYEQAKKVLQQSYDVYKQIGDRRGKTLALTNLGNVAIAQYEFEEAKKFLYEALESVIHIKSAALVLEILINLAELFKKENQIEKCLELTAIIINHPSSDEEVKLRAKTLLSQLKSEISTQKVADVIKESKEKVLQKVVEKILNED